MTRFRMFLRCSRPAGDGQLAPRRTVGARRRWLPLVFAACGLLAAGPAPAQSSQSSAEASEGGTSVLVIPPASQPRPAETRTADEFVLKGGLDEQARRRSSNASATLARGYRSVLTVLSAGRRDDALEALYAFETGAMEERGPREVERLFEAEVEVVRSLGRRDIEALVPVLVLHHDAYPYYVRQGEPFLAGHASRMAASLADLYAREGGSEGSRILGARALASLGIYAQQSGVKLQGLGLMLHALEYDPGNEAALLGIATVHERSGNSHRAAERLKELLDGNPRHREGRLRMAVNLGRLGSPEQARRLLEELVAEPSGDWVAAVAIQELARLHRAGGRSGLAEEVLWEGLERFPDDGHLRMQLAFVLDQRRRPQRAMSVVQKLATPGAGGDELAVGQPTPRRLYGMGPQEAYRAVIAGLEESASSRTPRLAQLLEGPGPRLARPAGRF